MGAAWAGACCSALPPALCRLSNGPSAPCCCCCLCRSGTYFCMDKSVTSVVIKGLAEHKDELGAPLCPCRHYDDKVGLAPACLHPSCSPSQQRCRRATQKHDPCLVSLP